MHAYESRSSLAGLPSFPSPPRVPRSLALVPAERGSEAQREASPLGVLQPGPPSPDEADVDTGVLRLSPEFLAALRGIAPPKRRRVLPYLFMIALAIVAGALGFESRTRAFLFAEWQRFIPSALPAPSVETPRVGSTVVAPAGSVAIAKPADLPGHAEESEVIVIPPAEVPAAAISEDVPPWKSATKAVRHRARTKVGSGRR